LLEGDTAGTFAGSIPTASMQGFSAKITIADRFGVVGPERRHIQATASQRFASVAATVACADVVAQGFPFGWRLEEADQLADAKGAERKNGLASFSLAATRSAQDQRAREANCCRTGGWAHCRPASPRLDNAVGRRLVV
jgi:hypothetical protein